ncbi:MAG: threonine synthase, partial [Bacteroidetes bacterium]|nr:threonine synthase [Bacteroidota bacterium]
MPVLTTPSLLLDLHCSHCGQTHSAFEAQTLSTCCHAPLLCRYALHENTVSKADLLTRPATLWRYREILPVLQAENQVSLGEGWTPLLSVNRLATQYGMKHLTL